MKSPSIDARSDHEGRERAEQNGREQHRKQPRSTLQGPSWCSAERSPRSAKRRDGRQQQTTHEEPLTVAATARATEPTASTCSAAT